MKTIGYMRVSTPYQKFDSQEQALSKFGVDKIYREQISGSVENRKQLKKALKLLCPGDTLVVFKLDRLARSTKHLLTLMEHFEKNDITFISIENSIDTSSPMGKFFFTIMSAFSEMESAIIKERIHSGLQAAQEKGIVLGRPTKKEKIEKAIYLYASSNLNVRDISIECSLSETTIYNHLKKNKIERRYNKISTLIS